MKRLLVLFMIGIVISLLCSGCTDKEPTDHTTLIPTISQDENTYPDQTALSKETPILTSEQIRLLYDCKEYKNGQMNDAGTFGFCNQISFGEIRNYLGDGVNGKALYSIVHLDSGNVSPISQPNNLGKWNVASGLNVIMKGRYLYLWLNYGDNEQGMINKLLRIDAESKRLTVVKQEHMKKTPFIYCSKLNENEFIYSYCDVENYGTADAASISVVRKYNVETGEEKEIIRERYQNIEGWQNSDGQLLESVCAIDNQLIAFGRKNVNNQYQYYLYQYNTDGTLLKTIPAQSLETVLNKSQPFQIQVIGSYLFFNSWINGVQYIYKIGSDDVSLIAGNPSDRISVVTNYENMTDSNKCAYLFYYHEPTPDGEHRDNYLYGIELATGRTKQIDVQTDQEKPYLRAVQIDENGNMILTMVPDHLKSLDVRQFYVTSETIAQLFANAPYID